MKTGQNSAFFILTYLLSWSIWIPLGLTNASSQGLVWLAGFGPSLTAIALTAFHNGWKGVHRLLQPGWKVRPIWYLVSLFGTPAVMLVAIGLHMLLGGKWPVYMDPNHMVTSLEQWPLVIVVFLYVFIFTALGEEIGWRAYVLPRLQDRFSPFLSSLILGFVWAFWHLPLFWMAGNFHQQLPLSWFVLQVLGSTILYTWLYNRTDGSLLIALLFHTSSNAAVGLLPILPPDNGGSMRPLWLVVGVLWLVVFFVLWFERGFFFSNRKCSSGLNLLEHRVTE